jgi:hypothetical protein
MAVALDTSGEQKVNEVRCQINNGAVVVALEAREECDLELWAAERASDAFRQIYNVPMTVERTRA